MTLRDGLGIAGGSSVSFFLGLLATEKDPRVVLWWGLGVSLGLMLVVLVLMWLRRAWLSVHVTPLATSGDQTVLQLGFQNHGSTDYGTVIVNVLIPDDVQVEECGSSGQQVTTNREFLHTPESIDSVHESTYWNHAMSFIRGSTLLHLRVTTKRKELPVRLHLGNTRKDLEVSLSALNASQDVNFSNVMPRVERILSRMS